MTQPPDLSFTLPIANLSINSTAGTLQEILKQEQIHWFYGLKSAELFILELQNALVYSYKKQREYGREIREVTRQRDKLVSSAIGEYLDYNQQLALRSGDESAQAQLMELVLAQINLVSPAIADQVEACADKISTFHRDIAQVQQIKIRDAQAELEIAQQQRDRILEKHPEAMEMGYTELQRRFAQIALLERQAHYMAARIWATHSGLPETVGVALFDVPIEHRPYIIQREMEIRSQLQVHEAVAHAGLVLADLPIEQQRMALLKAAETIVQSKNGGHDVHQ